MKKAMVVFGFIFFAVEILIGAIYGLSLVPWEKLGALFTDQVILVFFAIIWNVTGALFLYLGYTEDE